MRWGLGPVFLYECIAHSRRWQTFALRSAGVAVLLGAISTTWISHGGIGSRQGWREYAALGVSYFYSVIGVELTLVMLAAPAATAGAICVDRARGTLTHILATDLSDPEIVLGKLSARLMPVLGLVACSWPVLALSSLLGGIDPTALTLAFAIILAVALLGCTMALALSVWARKSHEVVLVVYTFWTLVMLLWPIWYGLSFTGAVGRPPEWSLVADPFYLAFAPYSAPGRVESWDYAGFFATTLGASAVLAILAVWRMRPVARRGIDGARVGTRLGLIGRAIRRLPAPALDGNPVFWREWHRSRPSWWLLILIVLLGGGTTVACAMGAYAAYVHGLGWPSPGPMQMAGIFGLMLQVIFGLLMLSAVSPMSMAEERQRGSLDLLAATTLSTPTIVLGKWLGVLRLVPMLAIAPGLLAFAFAEADMGPVTLPAGVSSAFYQRMERGEVLFAATLVVATILIHGALIASVGLVLAIWVARQGRAVALSVGFVVLLGVGWPFLVAAGRGGGMGQGLTCLSPILAVLHLSEAVASRFTHSREPLWWTAFWDAECLAMALGLLWLAVRTFDDRFGRIPERPARTPVLSDVVAVLAGVVGVAGLSGAIALWTWGVRTFMPAADLGALVGSLLVTAGFAMLAALASSSMSRERPAPAPSPAILDRRAFAARWWASFRLVPLLAIGPALAALAMATAPRAVEIVSKDKALAGGVKERIYSDPSGNIYVMTIAANSTATVRQATAEEIAAAEKLPQTHHRAAALRLAALEVVTILAHGAAYVSLGAALGVWIRRRRWAIAASVAPVVLVAVGWPILYLTVLHAPGDERWGAALVSPILAATGILARILHPGGGPMAIGWAGYGDVIMVLVAVIASALAIIALERRARGTPPASADAEESALQPAMGESTWG